MGISLQVFEARAFAVGAHAAVSQVRKYTGEPYHVHSEAVATTIARLPPTWNDNLDKDYEYAVMAAYLHDVVEDTGVTISNIVSEFGEVVAQLVEEVTDVSKPSDGNRAMRKEIDRQHLKGASFWGKTIKLADLIDNTTTIVAHDPAFAKVYLKEKKLLLEVLSDGHPQLFESATHVLEMNMKLLNL